MASAEARSHSSGFDGNVALSTFDFQAAATANAVCTLSVRVAFTFDDNDDNDDNGADYIGYYSSNNATAANHPQLVVTYLP